MKYALVFLLLNCVLFAQDKPAAEGPKPTAVEKASVSNPKISPINIRDELIELVHLLKKEAGVEIDSPLKPAPEAQFQAERGTKYESDMKAKTEAQRLLLQALVELSKEAAKDKPTVVQHSSTPVRPNR